MHNAQSVEWLKKRSFDLAAKLNVYASGNGSLSFVWSSTMLQNKGNAIAEKVSYEDALSLYLTKDDGHYLKNYSLVKLNNEFLIVQNFTIEGNTVTSHTMDKDIFTLDKDGNLWADIKGDKILVKHLSTLSAFKFWQENHKNWEVLQ